MEVKKEPVEIFLEESVLIKQEPAFGNIEVKEEPLNSCLGDSIKLEHENMFVEPPTMVNSKINNPQNITIKAETLQVLDILELKSEDLNEVDAKDLYVDTNDLFKLNQDIDDMKIKTDRLNELNDTSSSKSDTYTLNPLHRPSTSKELKAAHVSTKKIIKRKKLYPCEVCGRNFRSATSKEKHLNRHFLRRPVICTFSGKMFMRKDEFLNHHLTHFARCKTVIFKRDAGKKECRSCSICFKYFTTKLDFRQHSCSKVTNRKFSQCSTRTDNIDKKLIRKKATKSKNLFKKSTEICSTTPNLTSTTNGEKYKCEICFLQFTLRRDLHQHLKTHGEKPFQCETCLKRFRWKRDLMLHMRNHTNERPFKCDLCSKTYTQKYLVNKHMRTHAQQKPYPCEICSRQFIEKRGLVNHIRTHTGEKPFKCDICSKTFSVKPSLLKHIVSHNHEKNFECDICQKRFKYRSSLDDHLRFHDKNILFDCTICSKQLNFRYKSDVELHVKSHVEGKLYYCDICSKPFIHPSKLNVHMKSHSGEKPYKCEVCGKQFTLKSHVKTHIKIHSSEKPHKCEKCPAQFSYLTHLKTHWKVHEMDVMQIT